MAGLSSASQGAGGCLLLAVLAACSPAPSPQQSADTGPAASPAAAATPVPGVELPVRKMPNLPPGGEAYYAADSLHLIANMDDPQAQRAEGSGGGGSLTYVFTDDGSVVRRINDHGQDACSYFFPDMKQIVWTSTRDNMDMPFGNWFDDADYPRGAELYLSDPEGGNVRRLTHNQWYDAEVSVSPDGKWIVFGRQTDGRMDLWRMRADGSGEQQITRTDDWQEGAPFYMPDNETIMFRAWQRSVKNELRKQQPQGQRRWITPMTVFTIRQDGTGLTQRTFDRDMNWAPYPAPDGRHYVFVRVVDGNNWEVFLGDLAGDAPRRLTYSPGFDGLPSLSPDGRKMVFARQAAGFSVYVMDVSSLGLGPGNYKGIPATPVPDNAVIADMRPAASTLSE
ncbi:hypothetical protein GPROT2_00709 [Gammaproteobacteria bacterium]|nr:hypothetical protein GPROT2_00709 [Gammaproteobacteria bacterium]